MISKGALVVITHGDEGMSSAIMSGATTTMVPKSEVDNLERDYNFMKKHNREYWAYKIRKANRKYGLKKKSPTPKWAKPFVNGFLFLVYLYATFIDKIISNK